MQHASRKFVAVARPRLLFETLARRFGPRYYAASAHGQPSAKAVRGAEAELEVVPHPDLVKEFKGRAQNSLPCLAK